MLIAESEPALQGGQKVKIECEIVNTDRAVGTTLSCHVSKRFGEPGLPDDTIHVMLNGSAGQSFGAFLAPGITLELEGDANDYVGKGLSGGRIVAYPPKRSNFRSEENVIIGNVCLYGATSGKAFFRGLAAERFCVRNSGAIAVVEGCGDHGCEYMTGGKAVILGPTGRNFAAGMSGGIAYVLDAGGTFAGRCNTEMVELERVHDQKEIDELRSYIEEHLAYTGSEVARRVLESWPSVLVSMVKVMPVDYKRVLEETANRAAATAHVEADEQCETPNAKIEPLPVDIEDSAPDAEAIKQHAVVVDKLRGFMKYKRRGDPYRNPKRRANDWKEISARQNPEDLK
ncbi:MAG: alpha subunit of glutamate synthase, partial [Olpidium bornovanus]